MVTVRQRVWEQKWTTLIWLSSKVFFSTWTTSHCFGWRATRMWKVIKVYLVRLCFQMFQFAGVHCAEHTHTHVIRSRGACARVELWSSDILSIYHQQQHAQWCWRRRSVNHSFGMGSRKLMCLVQIWFYNRTHSVDDIIQKRMRYERRQKRKKQQNYFDEKCALLNLQAPAFDAELGVLNLYSACGNLHTWWHPNNISCRTNEEVFGKFNTRQRRHAKLN